MSAETKTAQPRIDSHHHFWHYTPQEYGWIGDNMKALRRDFLPPDLQREIRSAGISGVVSVQARQSLAETEWLLGFAKEYAFIRGVVGWVPLIDSGVGGILERYASTPKLKSIRHVLQDENDNNYILRDDFNAGVRQLLKTGLRYDILVFERHLPQTIEFVDKHPKQIFILDHIAKPQIRAHVISPWKERITELAKRPNVYCKISGMVTEADWKTWTLADLQPYIDVVLAAFGPKRLMFGSDWPVCLAASSYQRWFDTVKLAISKLSASEQDRILGGTASEAYRLQT